MAEGKLQEESSLKQKILLILFGLIVAILLSEGIFRIGGLIVNETKVKAYERKDKEIYRILCIGDSSTYGVGASDAKKYSYPSQLQKILDGKETDKRFEIINLGIPGINSSQVLHRFGKYLSEYNPDMVIVMVGMNDTWNLEESEILKFYNENILRKLYLSIELFLNRLQLYQFFKLVFISNKFKDSEYISFPEKELKLPYFNDETKSKGFKLSLHNPMKAIALYKAIESNLTAIKLIADKNNVRILFMEYHNGGWGRPERVIHQIYEKLKVPVVDNLVLFRKAKEKGIDVRGKDNWHPNDLGYLLIAKNIYNKMIDLNIVDSEPIEIFE
jgi:lysophospholipase L1-like esterase